MPTPPAAFGVVPIPADNPATPEKVALGRQLYFDSRLSADESRSCYSCHVCENGLTDGKPLAEGALGKKLPRSSPSLWNIAYHTEFYWDGRSPSLEKQAMAAWTGANMGAKAEEIATKLNAIEGYRTQFQQVFGADATPDNIVQAITSFERTYLFCSDTPYDRWQAGDQSALNDAAKRGAELFVAKAGCGNCHSGSLFTDMKYHNVGIGLDKPEPDLGRHRVTNADADKGAFKTPSLRDITKSAPYFHDGSVATLKEARRPHGLGRDRQSQHRPAEPEEHQLDRGREIRLDGVPEGARVSLFARGPSIARIRAVAARPFSKGGLPRGRLLLNSTSGGRR